MVEHLETFLIGLDNERSTGDATMGKEELTLRGTTDDFDYLTVGVQKLIGGADALSGTVPAVRRTGCTVRSICHVRHLRSAQYPFLITPFTLEPDNAQLTDAAQFLLRNTSCDLEEGLAHPCADILLRPATPSRSVGISPQIVAYPPRALKSRTLPLVLQTTPYCDVNTRTRKPSNVAKQTTYHPSATACEATLSSEHSQAQYWREGTWKSTISTRDRKCLAQQHKLQTTIQLLIVHRRLT